MIFNCTLEFVLGLYVYYFLQNKAYGSELNLTSQSSFLVMHHCCLYVSESQIHPDVFYELHIPIRGLVDQIKFS